MDSVEFLSRVDDAKLTALDRAKALLWIAGLSDPLIGLSTVEICKLIEQAGHPRQNQSRMARQLSADRKVSKVPGQQGWRLHPRGRTELDETFLPLLSSGRRPPVTSSILAPELFHKTRSYLEKVVFQINASYDATLYDCCAVMCRRLLETLIVEVYEAAVRPDAIKGSDGNFYMFADLLRIFENDTAFTMSRNGGKGLRDFKKLGDLSAHNRRFNAGKDDIDRVRDGLRVAAEELLHLAKLA